MCPPAQPTPADMGVYWSDDEIFSLLHRHAQGSCLPNNVLAEASPYQYPPSNLPEGIWYLVHLNEKRESVFGFWRARGEARKIYSNSIISGWRTTLEYFEGQPPDGQRTDWLMQEYKITQNELSDKDKPKDSKLLCRVFLSGGHGSKPEINSKDCKIVVESKQIDFADNITSPQDSGCESKEKKASKMGLLPATDEKQNSSTEVLPDLECLLRGDYLELNDLEDPESHSSSSQNSSCPSNLSDEYFDSLALLRDLEEDVDSKYTQEKQYSSITTSVRPNDLVMQPAASGLSTTRTFLHLICITSPFQLFAKTYLFTTLTSSERIVSLFVPPKRIGSLHIELLEFNVFSLVDQLLSAYCCSNYIIWIGNCWSERYCIG